MPDSTFLSPIARVTVSDEIVRRIIGFILELQLKPGDKLPTERELMAQLSVGRSSLREAIKTLSAVGVVRVAGREGMFVGGGDSTLFSKPLSWALLLGERSARSVVEARRAVEVELAGLAAERASDEGLAAIEHSLTNMRAAISDPQAFTRSDLEFHLTVAHAADSEVLYQLLQTLRHIVQAWIEKVLSGNEGHPRSFEEHVRLVEAIRTRDSAAAREAMALHLDRAAQRLLDVVAGVAAQHQSTVAQPSQLGTSVRRARREAVS